MAVGGFTYEIKNCAISFLFFNGPTDSLVYQEELFDLLH